MVVAWNVRLGFYLFTRILRSGHDKRLDEIKRSPARFFVAWTLQALWVFLDSLPVIAANALGGDVALGAFGWAMVVVWASGWLLQVKADSEKWRFRADPANRNRFISTGVWAYSRHPNYFGQIVGTVSLALFCWPALPAGWPKAVLAAPLFETALLLFASGIPPLERSAKLRWGDDADYKAYVAATNVLVPWWPRRQPAKRDAGRAGAGAKS
jgi:steroid 5-alpha reductase family enzyme